MNWEQGQIVYEVMLHNNLEIVSNDTFLSNYFVELLIYCEEIL